MENFGRKKRMRKVRKAERSRARGILLVPDWPGSSFYMLIKEKLREGKIVIEEKFSLMMTCPREIVSNTFRGALKFEMVILSFDFRSKAKGNKG